MKMAGFNHAARILIAEDNNSQLLLLKAFFDGFEGVDVKLARNGTQAVAFSNQMASIDLAIIDLHIPKMDGIQILERLARRSQLPAVIIISGNYSDLLSAGKRAANELGLLRVACLPKPICPDKLKAEMQSLLQHNRLPVMEGNMPLIEIVNGLARNQFCAYYQPIYDMRSGQAVQVEALARWLHPQMGVINPAAFISTLEHECMLSLLTRRIVQTSLDMLLAQGSHSNLKVSINLSQELLLDNEFTDWLIGEVELRKIRFSRVVLEITEKLGLSDSGYTLSAIIRLRMRGFGISLDDFGVGSTTLEHIKDLPITELKFDKSIIQGICHDYRCQSIVSGMTSIASSLGIEMVAEGVDNIHDLQYLKSKHPAIRMQGFYLCKPSPADVLTEKLLAVMDELAV
ncbi:EAL domain-containing protein [Aquitalea sp. LB_tupeE]|uniref:EAL domain-containing response regulator n=1 Tax=Aquitalea sp. LB_tupeE TaxID=2748078 RepID=UPI0015C0E2CF|nr:EAL domain-containing protein [Aquitalea sp. LB_tupeE]NWK79905.1 EAL domain-containing protein [Aquitalea sp. LB_tupeE]